LDERDSPGTGQDLAFRQGAVFDHQSPSPIIAALGVLGDECLHLGIDGRLQHPPGPLANEVIERTFLVEPSVKRNNFLIDRFTHWHGVTV
jgi:hypothetical protein